MLIAVNGWILTEKRSGPLAAHLHELLAGLERLDAQLELTVVHRPGQIEGLPEGVGRLEVPGERTPWGRLRFEQRELPRAAARAGAGLILSLTPAAPLASPVPVAVARGGAEGGRPKSFVERLRWALGAAGARGAAVLEYSDLPSRSPPAVRAVSVPPAVGSAFRATASATDRAAWGRHGLEQGGYVLCFGAEAADVPLLLAAWTWVDGSLGDAYPLVLLGLDPQAAGLAQREAARLDLSGSIRVLAGWEAGELPAIYRGAEAFLHPGYTGLGQELRWALAAGVPVVSPETPQMATLLQDAAYLAPPGDSRALGAACLTLLVEPVDVARPLREKGLLRARAYHGEAPLKAFLEALLAAR